MVQRQSSSAIRNCWPWLFQHLRSSHRHLGGKHCHQSGFWQSANINAVVRLSNEGHSRSPWPYTWDSVLPTSMAIIREIISRLFSPLTVPPPLPTMCAGDILWGERVAKTPGLELSISWLGEGVEYRWWRQVKLEWEHSVTTCLYGNQSSAGSAHLPRIRRMVLSFVLLSPADWA